MVICPTLSARRSTQILEPGSSASRRSRGRACSVRLRERAVARIRGAGAAHCPLMALSGSSHWPDRKLTRDPYLPFRPPVAIGRVGWFSARPLRVRAGRKQPVWRSPRRSSRSAACVEWRVKTDKPYRTVPQGFPDGVGDRVIAALGQGKKGIVHVQQRPHAPLGDAGEAASTGAPQPPK